LWRPGSRSPVSFYIVYYGTFIGGSIPAAYITSRYGYKHVAWAAAPFILVFYLALRSLATPTPVLYLWAAVGGIGFVTYWVGMNSEMARNSHDDRRDEETGYFFSMPMIGSVLSPFVGGVIITAFSFRVLFLTAAALVMVSYLPFLLSREHYSGTETGFTSFFTREYRTDFLTFVANGATSIGKKVLWPLYLAVVITGSLSIGGAGSLLALGGAIISILLGTYTDRGNRDRVLAYGGVLVAITFLAMISVTGSTAAFIVSFFNGAAYVVATLPLYTKVIGAAEHEDIIGYFVFREIALCTGRVLTLIGLIGLFIMIDATAAFRYGLVGIAMAALLLAVGGSRMHHGED
jgi:predicted MFS family arabinose efflux permease